METILKVADLKKLFPVNRGIFFKGKRQFIHAVDGVSFEIEQGETFGIVGESGCGKTTLGRLILRLTEPTNGKIFFKGINIISLSGTEMKKQRRQMQMIFQDPYSSLNPRKNILDIIAEPLRVHGICENDSMIEERGREALGLVELPTSADFLTKVPDELSGGERQRVGIARALIIGAEFIVADEPVSMLDANVKAGITSLIMGLKQKIGLTYVFITHEIGLAYHICDRIAVIYLGKVVELGDAEDIVKSPLQPYTKLMIDAVPPLYPDDTWGRTISERGELPFFIEPPAGCRFHTRCVQVQDICRVKEPPLAEIEAGHYAACHQYRPLG